MQQTKSSHRSQSWVQSKFNIAERINKDTIAIYNTASGALVTVSEEVWKRYFTHNTDLKLKSSAVSELKTRGIFVPLGFDELAAARLRFERTRFSSNEFSAVVTPTLGCNLRCSYCFEGSAQERAESQKMSRGVEVQLIRWLAEAVRGCRRLNVTWYGGEPLLALQTIERVSAILPQALDTANIGYSATIITNGTHLTKTIAVRLVRARVSAAQISVDVPAETRNNGSGQLTRTTALDGALAALNEGIQVSLRVNVMSTDEDDFDALYEELLQRGLETKLRRIEFYLVRTPEAPRASHTDNLGISLPAFEEVMLRERRKALSFGFPALTVNFSRHALCMAVRDKSAVIGPDGRLYKCMEEVGLIERSHGSIMPGVIPSDGNLLPWLTYDWFSHQQCVECVFLPQCAGGCPHRRLFAPERLQSKDFCFSEITSNIRDRIRLYTTYGLLGGRPNC